MSYRHFLYLLFLTVLQLTQQRFLCPILSALPQQTANLRADCPCSCALKKHTCFAAGQPQAVYLLPADCPDSGR